ncbi:Mannose-p-dolichol utilization defect 1 protein, partial [Globisporangium splendens]
MTLLKYLPVVLLAALAASAAVASTTTETTTTAAPSQELVFGVFTPACFDAFFTHHDFANVACLKLVVSKALGYAIITGSLILKLPQILKILSAKDVTGLTPASFYMEVLLYVSSTVYNVLRGYPVSTWGENLVILVQNVILVLLLWTYYIPKIAYATRFGLLVLFAVLTAGMLLTPPEYQWALASAGIPVSIIARIPQIISNFKQGHTGQLAFVTLLLNFGGGLARLFTTLQETGDIVQLLGFGVGSLLNGTLVLQVLIFWGATNNALAKAAKKKAD